MTIRFNPDLYAGVVDGLNTNNAQQSQALQELSTGRRVSQPSDDPQATAAVINIHWQTAQVDQYAQSINNIQGFLQTADSTLSSVVTSLNQAISLGVQAGDGTLTGVNRANIASQIQSVTQQVLTLANTSYQGTYIFAGTASGQPPYVANAASPNGVTYQGNGNSNNAEVGPGQTVVTNVPGSKLFSDPSADLFGALTNLAQAAQTNTGVSAAVTQLKAAFDHVSAQRTQIGSASQQVSTAASFLSNDKVQLGTQENSTIGIDIAQAASDVQKALTQRSALLAAGGQIQKTSLMDYLQ
jgi:flagellar hook-associated protein 3 FlgL